MLFPAAAPPLGLARSDVSLLEREKERERGRHKLVRESFSGRRLKKANEMVNNGPPLVRPIQRALQSANLKRQTSLTFLFFSLFSSTQLQTQAASQHNRAIHQLAALRNASKARPTFINHIY